MNLTISLNKEVSIKNHSQPRKTRDTYSSEYNCYGLTTSLNVANQL